VDRERFEPLTRYANPALWGTYGLGIVGRRIEGQLELSSEDAHRLGLLVAFLESARRGALPVSELREEHRRRVQELDAPKYPRQRYVPLSRDIEAFDLIAELLPEPKEGEVEEAVRSWVDQVLSALRRLTTVPWPMLSEAERSFVEQNLIPVLSHLAVLTQESDYKIRSPWNVVAV
jgi:hypothetical protein